MRNPQRIHTRRQYIEAFAFCFLFALMCGTIFGQGQPAQQLPAVSPQIIVPQAQALSNHQNQHIVVEKIDAKVEITSDEIVTDLTTQLNNRSTQPANVQLWIPVPAGASLSSGDNDASDVLAKTGLSRSETKSVRFDLLQGSQTQKTYNAAAQSSGDVALLEFLGSDFLRSTAITIPANSRQSMSVRYWQSHTNNAAINYQLPRSERVTYQVPWTFQANADPGEDLVGVYSPSHRVELNTPGKDKNSVMLTAPVNSEPGPVRLVVLRGQDEPVATVVCSPNDVSQGGHFLLLLGLPKDIATDNSGVHREITLVVDRSASMRGERLTQVQAAVQEVVSSLREDETFNIIQYNDKADRFANSPVEADRRNRDAARRYVESIQSRGGTNFEDALKASLQQKPTEGSLPIVLFLTDGLPTVGSTSEPAISELVTRHNKHNRRIFTVGVTVDVNTVLLSNVARNNRGQANFVLPQQDIRMKIRRIMQQLAMPVFTDLHLSVHDSNGQSNPERIRHLQPTILPDMFQGGQLVLLGEYRGVDPFEFRLQGKLLGKPHQMRIAVDPTQANRDNAYVARLWSIRRIAALHEQIREIGGTLVPSYGLPRQDNNPKIQALAEEILALSNRYGVITEYTRFLADQHQSFTGRDAQLKQAMGKYDSRAIRSRIGLPSVNQEINNGLQREQNTISGNNCFFDESMNRIVVQSVQFIDGQSFFRRGDNWVDGRLLQRSESPQPEITYCVGTPDYQKLSERLAEEGRAGILSQYGNILTLENDRVLKIEAQPEIRNLYKMPNWRIIPSDKAALEILK